jgi:hypothetical protein
MIRDKVSKKCRPKRRSGGRRKSSSPKLASPKDWGFDEEVPYKHLVADLQKKEKMD